MEVITKVLGIVMVLLGVGFMSLMIHESILLEEGTKKVKCYDEFSNEIIRLECVEETTWEDKVIQTTAGGFIGIMMIMMGVIMYDLKF